VRAVAGGPAALGHPVVEPGAARLVPTGLVEHVRLGVYGVPGRGLAWQGALGQQPGLVEARLVLAG